MHIFFVTKKIVLLLKGNIVTKETVTANSDTRAKTNRMQVIEK